MIIENGCARLRAIEEKDFTLLYEMLQSETIEKAMGHCTLPISQAQQKEWMSNYRNTEEQIRLMVELTNGETIGVVMLYDIDMKNGTAEIGYKSNVSKEYRMRGDMRDAIEGMLKYAFLELRLNCIYARVIDGNETSERLLMNARFLKEGTLRQRIYQSGVYYDESIFSLLKEEFVRDKE